MASKQVENLPSGLKQFIEKQPGYTWPQHAAWRYIRRVGHPFYLKHAHPSYEKSVKLVGIEIDKIPRISEMDRRLDRVDFGATGVNGLIHPRAFMALQKYKVAPISTDMRRPKNIAYTPSPDIVHEALGHTSMFADPHFGKISVKFGDLGLRVRDSPEDLANYEAVRRLSILEEDSNASKQELEDARKHLAYTEEKANEANSESRQLSGLHWWIIEYGLIEYNGGIKICGAGLISSIGEGRKCLDDSVKKIPLSLEAADTSYDITKPQPQLFVAESFPHVLDVLDQFGQRLKGGYEYDLNKLEKSKQRTRIETPTTKSINLDNSYSEIRSCREGSIDTGRLHDIWNNLRKDHPDDWIAGLEILKIFQ